MLEVHSIKKKWISKQMTRPGEQYLIECYVHKPRLMPVRFIDDISTSLLVLYIWVDAYLFFSCTTGSQRRSKIHIGFPFSPKSNDARQRIQTNGQIRCRKNFELNKLVAPSDSGVRQIHSKQENSKSKT